MAASMSVSKGLPPLSDRGVAKLSRGEAPSGMAQMVEALERVAFSG